VSHKNRLIYGIYLLLLFTLAVFADRVNETVKNCLPEVCRNGVIVAREGRFEADFPIISLNRPDIHLK